MIQNDLDFIIDLKEQFFSQRKIQHALSTIEKNGISAWETWWQVEFATFLSLHKNGHEWHREHQIDVDRRKDKEKSKLIADFTIRPKKHAKDRFILLELKQNSSIITCVTNMAKDVLKVDKAKSSSIIRRSFWCVGVHPKESKKKVRTIVETAADKFDIELFDAYTKFIPNTGLAFTIF